MRFLVLGPIEVWRDEDRLPLGAGRERALLVRLVLARGRPVTAGLLVADLWEDDPPANGDAQVRTHISRLRRVLGTETIVRDATGYRLVLAGHELDVVQFERLLATGSPADALALWRGPALDDLADRPFARAEAQRLEELRFVAIEERIDADLRAGRHAHLVAELEWQLAAQPLRERLWGALVVALYRSGRQTEALRAYQRARDTLEQVGVEPGSELRRLEALVLAQDPVLNEHASLGLVASPVTRRRAGVLPAEVTEFIGRADDQATVETALRESRIVTLTGVGGVGKTRLATRVARTIAPSFRDGVRFCDLAPVADAEQVAAAVADALAIDAQVGDDGGAIVDELAEQHTLLVLDNCEHVVGGVAPLVEAAARRGPDVVVLATSREPLGIPGERVVAVRPFGVLPTDREQDDAVRLFVSRARDVNAAFPSDAQSMADVAEACRLVEGIPLAIELAAARMASMTVADLVERLHDRFDVLTAAPRAGPSRHRGLKATIDWSHDLLADTERAVLARCSVFAGGWRLAAAEAVAACSVAPRSVVLDSLGSLAGRSLLVVESVGGRARYRMLETIRQYAADRLDERGQVRDARRAHLDWCTAFVQDAAAGLRSADDVEWTARAVEETGNLRAALTYAVAERDLDAVAILLGSLPAAALIGTPLGSTVVTAGLAVAEEVGGSDHPAAAALLALRAIDAIFRDANDEAIELATRGCAIARAHGTWLGNMPWYVACVASVNASRVADVLSLADEALAAAVERGDDWAIAEMTSERATMSLMLGRFDEAIAGALDGLRRAHTTGCSNLVLRGELLAGMCLLAPGSDPAEALAHLDESIRLSLRAGNVYFGSAALFVAGFVREAASPQDAARAFLGMYATIATFHERGMLRMFLPPVATLLVGAGQFEAAAVLFGAGRDMQTKGPLLTAFSDATVVALRTELGPDRYDELVAAGRGLTLDDAVDRMVRALEEVAGDAPGGTP